MHITFVQCILYTALALMWLYDVEIKMKLKTNFRRRTRRSLYYLNLKQKIDSDKNACDASKLDEIRCEF